MTDFAQGSIDEMLSAVGGAVPLPPVTPKAEPARPVAMSSTPSGGSRRSAIELPPYTKSLLKIKVPVVVTLAEKRQPLSRIVEIGPGAIIQFDKSCEELLELSVNNQPVAAGEAIKVGDKFGLRIVAIIPPDERFQAVKQRMKDEG